MLRNAAQDVLTDDADVEDLFMYGNTGGDPACLEELAKFLSVEYGEEVSQSSLMLTNAATHGLHMILTTLFFQHNPVYVESPCYFYGQKIISEDLKRETIPVQFDDKGMIPEDLDRLLAVHRPSSNNNSHPYWAAVYLGTVFQNPSGVTYPPDRCSALVDLAYRHNVLLLTEDIYNLIYFTHAPSPRLLSYDKQVRSERKQDKGHVVSVGTFSKFMAPSLRFGWIEAPENVLSALNNSSYSNGGGSFHHFLSKLLTSVLKSGVLHGHVAWLRQVYKLRMSAMTQVLTSDLPQGCHFVTPQGGFFIWLCLRPGSDAAKFLDFAVKHAGVSFMPGIHFSPTAGHVNYARLSISVADQDTIREGTRKLCQVYKEFIGET